MWTTNYIISQVFALFFIIIFGATFFVKNKKLLQILYISASLCLGIEYLFLEAYAGMVSSFVSIIATLWFLINEKLNKKKDKLSLIVTSLIFIVLGIVFFQGWIDIIIMIASVGANYAIWQDNPYVYRIFGLSVSLFWLTYDIFYFTILQMVSDVVLFVIKLVGTIKLVRDRKRQQ